MPVITMSSPKGGPGKSTGAVLLACGFAREGAEVTLLDTDPNQSITRWAAKERGVPQNIKVIGNVGSKNIIDFIQKNDQDGRIIIVDTEGVADQVASRSILLSDLVLVPMQPMDLDAEIGAESIAHIRDEEVVARRKIKHAVYLNRTTGISWNTRAQREIIEGLKEAGVNVLKTTLMQRSPYTELFRFGGSLYDMRDAKDIKPSGDIHKAIENAEQFVEAVYEQLK